MLPAEVNTGYESLQNEIIETVNGIQVKNFSQFVELLENDSQEFIEFTTNLGNIIVLDRQEAIAANQSIMARYGILLDRVLL